MLSYLKKSDEKQRWLIASTLLNAVLAASKVGWGIGMESTLVTADGIRTGNRCHHHFDDIERCI